VSAADSFEPTSVLLVRHGQSTWNADGRWQGHADPPLSELGRAQAVAARVPPVDLVMASDLQRARETARLMADALGGLEVHVDPRFRERAAGPWTGLTRAEIQERYPGYLDEGRRPPGFELDSDIIGRVLEALHDLHGRHPGGRVLVVAHGGVVRALERHLGCDDAIVPNLGGRWLSVHADWVTPGERTVLIEGDVVPVTRPPQL